MTPLRSEKNSFNVSESDCLMTGFKDHSICDQNKKIGIYIIYIYIYNNILTKKAGQGSSESRCVCTQNK